MVQSLQKTVWCFPKNLKLEIPRAVKFADRKQNDGCQGLRGRGSEELLFNGYGVRDENVLEINSGAGSMTVSMCVKPLNCT